MKPDWLAAFPELAEIGDEDGLAALAASREVTLPAGTTAFRLGEACQHYLLVVAGSVKVRELGSNGREIILYRVRSGESCVLTTACLLGEARYAAEGITETETRAVLIPADRFRRALDLSPAFRRFVFRDYGQRLAELLGLIEDIAFRRLDERLAERLLALADEDGKLQITHQELAAELGSAREVITRQLHALADRGWIRLNRGTIRLVAPEALARLVQGD